MQRITQRELRNQSGEIMRRLDEGEDFLVTRNGVAVAELMPNRRRRFVKTEAVLGAFADAPALDGKAFRDEVDQVLDQDPTVRG